MLDRRQQILDRLAAVLLPLVESPKHFTRNRDQLPDKLRPAITLLDADEVADTRPFDKAKRGLAQAPNLMRLSPEIIITLRDSKPPNPNVGQELNQFRVSILAAVLFDDALNSLVGTNGEIQYRGCETDLGRGRTMQGEMAIALTFVYFFNPSDLQGT